MGLKDILSKFDISSEREDYTTIHDTVELGIEFKGTNLWILIFAIFIASIGLNVNSTAVIIGAMLISPLMGPILGIGYSIATYDFPLLRKSIVHYLFAVMAGLVTSAIYFFVTPIYQAHSELLARTQPNIYDVLIALLGGLAGMVALSSRNRGNVIPGVAIATALMPPLCTAGYGLATLQWNFFFGALYLLLINTVFIGTATLLTVRILNYPIRFYTDEGKKRSANRWVSFIVVLTAVPSLYYGYLLVQQEQFTQNANRFVVNESYIEGDYLLKTDFNYGQREIVLTYGGKKIGEDEKQRLQQRLSIYGLADTEVIIQQGFSVNDDVQAVQELSKADKYAAEINQLKSTLSLNLAKEDSIRRAELIADNLFKEIKSFFPEIYYISARKQAFFGDSTAVPTYTVVVLGSKESKKTMKELPKIKKWLTVRMGTDSLKLFVER
ncbi:putative hydrophobic protein (TIGR00341 family) [Dyadobacter jejuensis]|uniref:Putative hydrophobic protein (TIGR00341 family) n=1 Tax=Dyadobacter jejuensis TaxID=1082580 RepID=A0A316ASA8_9BACT|nr:DUF389 domain-containing protein [Dyadobacter jejuensis]PWJ60575.1 putative hydrophobic protein (TIGR00341 family) [Dyadobacter jejuensis]